MDSVATTDQLIAAACAAESGSDAYGETVEILRQTHDRTVFDVAVGLLASPDPRCREVGVDVVSGFGELVPHHYGTTKVVSRDHPFPEDASDALLALLGTEREPSVLAALGHGFAYAPDDRATAPLAALRGHPDEEVRYAVVMGLLTREDDVAVEALIELSTDVDSDVRDWATFGLGTQIELDTPEIRAALAARLDDPDDDTREEGLFGLAHRGDARAIQPIADECEEYESPTLNDALCALAAKTGDERLRPHVVWVWDEAAQRGTPLAPDRDESDQLLVAAAARYGLS